MKVVTTVALFSFLSSIAAANVPQTIAQFPEAREFLRRTTNPQFYHSILNAPMSESVTVRGELAGDRLLHPQIVRSNAEPAFNDLALELARNLQIIGGNIYRSHGERAVLLHVLVYDIADGKLAISFSHFDEPGAGQMRNHGAAWMAVRKNNGEWVTIQPRWHLAHEHRGPRSYAFFAQQPGVPQRFRSTGIPSNPGQITRPGAE